MKALELTKATVVCAALAFVVYSYPVVGQVLIIGALGVVWLSYLHKVIARL